MKKRNTYRIYGSRELKSGIKFYTYPSDLKVRVSHDLERLYTHTSIYIYKWPDKYLCMYESQTAIREVNIKNVTASNRMKLIIRPYVGTFIDLIPDNTELRY